MEIYNQSFLYNKVIEILRKYAHVYKEESYQGVIDYLLFLSHYYRDVCQEDKECEDWKKIYDLYLDVLISRLDTDFKDTMLTKVKKTLQELLFTDFYNDKVKLVLVKFINRFPMVRYEHELEKEKEKPKKRYFFKLL